MSNTANRGVAAIVCVRYARVYLQQQVKREKEQILLHCYFRERVRRKNGSRVKITHRSVAGSSIDCLSDLLRIRHCYSETQFYKYKIGDEFLFSPKRMKLKIAHGIGISTDKRPTQSGREGDASR